jgi:hypothetical protein
MLAELKALFGAVGIHGSREDYERAILFGNVLSKRSDSTRRRSLRYLRELYGLDPASALFRGLSNLWVADVEAQPLLALIAALSRDALLRATAPVIIGLSLGSRVTAKELAEAVSHQYPNSYGDAVAGKIGRNAASSWTQSGHLAGHRVKIRVHPDSRPACLALALWVGHLAGAAGAGLFETVYARSLDRPTYALYDDAFAATKRGWIDFRQAGEVVEVGFRWFSRDQQAKVV